MTNDIKKTTKTAIKILEDMQFKITSIEDKDNKLHIRLHYDYHGYTGYISVGSILGGKIPTIYKRYARYENAKVKARQRGYIDPVIRIDKESSKSNGGAEIYLSDGNTSRWVSLIEFKHKGSELIGTSITK